MQSTTPFLRPRVPSSAKSQPAKLTQLPTVLRVLRGIGDLGPELDSTPRLVSSLTDDFPVDFVPQVDADAAALAQHTTRPSQCER